MQPKIKTAEHQISFKLTDEYIASAYADVESMGMMQYLHFLVVHGPDKKPEFFVCAEWLDHDTLNKYAGLYLASFLRLVTEAWGMTSSGLTLICSY
jgi:hypothetical protein